MTPVQPDLAALAKAFTDAVERLAFEMPPPNAYTPRFVQMCIEARPAFMQAYTAQQERLDGLEKNLLAARLRWADAQIARELVKELLAAKDAEIERLTRALEQIEGYAAKSMHLAPEFRAIANTAQQARRAQSPAAQATGAIDHDIR